jgi:integrase
MIKVDPGNPKYAGIYYNLDKQNIKTFYINYRDHNGKPKNEKVGIETMGFTKTDALNLRKKRMHEVTFGVKPEDTIKKDTPTMDVAFGVWMQWAVGNLSYPPTNEMSRYNHHIEPYFGKVKLDQIEPQDIERAKRKWKQSLSNSSIQQVEILFNRIYNKMKDLEIYTGRNPMDNIRRTKANVRRLRFLNKAQAEAVLEYLHGKDIISWAQACFGLYAGLRPSEIKRLTKMSVTLDTNMLVIENVKHSSNQAKTRWVPIHPQLLEVIHDMNLDTYGVTELLLPGWKGHLFKDALADLNKGVDPKDKAHWVSFYTLRHTFGTWLVQAGTHPKVIQSMMGHDTAAATEIYMKSVPDLEVKAMENLARLWKED